MISIPLSVQRHLASIMFFSFLRYLHTLFLSTPYLSLLIGVRKLKLIHTISDTESLIFGWSFCAKTIHEGGL